MTDNLLDSEYDFLTFLKVQDFYVGDDISKILPGKKDYVSVRLAKQELFKAESNLQIGKSKFAEIKPSQLIRSSVFDQQVCIGKYTQYQ